MKIPTDPLSKPIYLAPFKPNEVLRITGNGNPYFWEGLPIKLENKIVKNVAIKPPKNTTKKFKS